MDFSRVRTLINGARFRRGGGPRLISDSFRSESRKWNDLHANSRFRDTGYTTQTATPEYNNIYVNIHIVVIIVITIITLLRNKRFAHLYKVNTVRKRAGRWWIINCIKTWTDCDVTHQRYHFWDAHDDTATIISPFKRNTTRASLFAYSLFFLTRRNAVAQQPSSPLSVPIFLSPFLMFPLSLLFFSSPQSPACHR